MGKIEIVGSTAIITVVVVGGGGSSGERGIVQIMDVVDAMMLGICDDFAR